MSFKFQLSSFEKQGFHLKLLFSERRMSHSHVAIQKFAPMISACNAVFCNCLNCQLWQAFNKHKSIFLVSKIYPAYTVYVAFACHVQRFYRRTVQVQLRNSVNKLACHSFMQILINVAKCNLGKVNLEAMLVRSFSSYTRGGLTPLAGAPRELYICSCLLVVLCKVLLQ